MYLGWKEVYLPVLEYLFLPRRPTAQLKGLNQGHRQLDSFYSFRVLFLFLPSSLLPLCDRKTRSPEAEMVVRKQQTPKPQYLQVYLALALVETVR